MSAPEKLSPGMPLAIETGPTALSVVSYWEVMLKQTALSDFAATLLPLRSDHIAEVYNLPPIHQDPFDRHSSSKPRSKTSRW